MLTNNANLPFEEQNKILLSTFNEWKNSYIQMDDTTIIGVKI